MTDWQNKYTQMSVIGLIKIWLIDIFTKRYINIMIIIDYK